LSECSLTRLANKFLNLNLDGWNGVGHWSDAGDGFPVLVDDEFGEIPLDPRTQETALLLLQPFPQRCCVFTIHIHLCKHVKGGSLGGGKCFDIRLAAWLLGPKLVAWESKNGQLASFAAVLLVQGLQLSIVDLGLSSSACHIHHDTGPSLVHAKVHLLSINVLDGEIMKTGRGSSAHREKPQCWPWC